MSNPIEWLDTTFASREQTQQLLRPDLESGLLSQHDYQTATLFFPVMNRYWPYYYSAIGTAMGVGWARWLKRPPMSSRGQVIVGLFAGWCGSVYGKFRRLKLHIQVLNTMENPIAFSQALENVSERTGRPLPRGLRVQDLRDMHNLPPSPDDEHAAQSAEGSGLDGALHTHSNENRAPRAPMNVSHRWEDIRKANAGSAAQSSWEALRQKQGRNVPSNAGQATSTQTSTQSDVDIRAQEQAEFDAMLEAERKVARG